MNMNAPIKLIILCLIASRHDAARPQGPTSSKDDGDAHHVLEKPTRGAQALYIHSASVGQHVKPIYTSSQCEDGSCDANDLSSSHSFCGDGTCDADETCTSCPYDCTCTSPNCPPEATSCTCPDRATTCSTDQDCPSSTKRYAGACSGSGFRSGLPCSDDVYCPKIGGLDECIGFETVEIPPEEGSCRSCGGVQKHSGLIIGDINQCEPGDVCGDFTNNTNPVTCVSCLTPMTCDTWCKIENNFGRYDGQFLESHRARTNCPGGGFDSCSCTIASFMSDSRMISSNTHDGAICNAHNFGTCGKGRDWCTSDFPHGDYCESLGTVSISGTLTDGVCTCHATVGTTTKDVWSSKCIENLYMYYHGPHGNGNGTLPAVALPCFFTG